MFVFVCLNLFVDFCCVVIICFLLGLGVLEGCFVYYDFFILLSYLCEHVMYFILCGYLLFCVYCICVGVLFINFSFIGDYMFGCCWVCALCLCFSVLVLGEVFRPSFFNFLL